jgi:hypothetical protein
MPLIAYQSFNANSSKNPGLAATSLQRFTRDTNAYVTAQGHQALVLPSDSGNLGTPIQGPAHLKPIEALPDAPKVGELLPGSLQPIGVFGAQISLMWQNIYRELGAMPDILVCGEMDTSHPDFTGMLSDPNMTSQPIPAKKACQSFTAISQTPLPSLVAFLTSGEGYVVYSVAGLVVVFVHVPNKIATSKDKTQEFYFKIAAEQQVKGQIIDLVIGDTNQPSFNFTADALNVAFKTTEYTNATAAAKVTKIDNFNVVENGTNSNGTRMYDVAVYRKDLVDLKRPPVYLSQSSGAVTVTDHCGLGVFIERKKTGS